MRAETFHTRTHQSETDCQLKQLAAWRRIARFLVGAINYKQTEPCPCCRPALGLKLTAFAEVGIDHHGAQQTPARSALYVRYTTHSARSSDGTEGISTSHTSSYICASFSAEGRPERLPVARPETSDAL